MIDAKSIYDYIMKLQEENYTLTLENKNLKAQNEEFRQAAESKLIDLYISLKKSELPTSTSKETTAEWEIDCDGYRPYCTKCKFEPYDYALEHEGELPRICPNCGAEMINSDNFKRKRPRINESLGILGE